MANAKAVTTVLSATKKETFDKGHDAVMHHVTVSGNKWNQSYRRVPFHELTEGKLEDGLLRMVWSGGTVHRFLADLGRLLHGVTIARKDVNTIVPPRLLPGRTRIVTVTAKSSSETFRGTFQVLAYNPAK